MQLQNLTYKDLPNVNWPAYVLDSSLDLRFEDKIFSVDGKVIDDRNQPGGTLGHRRLQTKLPLYTFKRAVTDIVTLVNCRHSNFIDRLGNTFHYNKTEYVLIQYKKIQKIKDVKVMSLLYIKDFLPLPIARPPSANLSWAAIAFMGPYPILVYDYADKKLSSFRKKI